MILFPKGARHFVRLLVAFRAFALGQVAATETRWVGTWATAPLAEPADKGKRSLAGATLRQVGHVSLGGGTLRVRFSNAFGGPGALSLRGAPVALAAPGGAIQPGSDWPLRGRRVAPPSLVEWRSNPSRPPCAAEPGRFTLQRVKLYRYR